MSFQFTRINARVLALACVLAFGLVVLAGCASSTSTPPGTAGTTAILISSSSKAASSSSTAETVDTSTHSNANNTIASQFFRVTLPSDLDNKGTFEFVDENETILEYRIGKAVAFRVSRSLKDGETQAERENERKANVYDLGRASDGTDGCRVYLTIHYVKRDSNGTGWTNVHWGDTSTETLACDAILHMTDEELARCVELKDGTNWTQAYLGKLISDGAKSARKSHPESSTTGSGETSNPSSPNAAPVANAPFWGIWVSASKDRAAAEETASAVSSANLGGSVVLTTDWSNLNSEPWYVVTAGRYATQQEAESHLDTVKSAGYGDAYIKYSGDYQG